jgi:hypothetical protein
VLLSKNILRFTHLKHFQNNENKNYITMIWEVQIWLFWGHLFSNSFWITCVSYIQNCKNTKECHHVCLWLPTVLKTTITCKPCDANLFHLHCTTSLGFCRGCSGKHLLVLAFPLNFEQAYNVGTWHVCSNIVINIFLTYTLYLKAWKLPSTLLFLFCSIIIIKLVVNFQYNFEL